MSGAEFRDAPDVAEVVRAVIEEVPDTHGHLRSARIRCLRRTGRWVVRGETRWAHVRVLPAELRHVAGADIVLTVNSEVWDAMDKAHRRALIDHELSHVVLNDAGNWTTVGHDVEDFIGVVRRRGLWRAEVEEFIRAAEAAQAQLPLGEGLDIQGVQAA